MSKREIFLVLVSNVKPSQYYIGSFFKMCWDWADDIFRELSVYKLDHVEISGIDTKNGVPIVFD